MRVVRLQAGNFSVVRDGIRVVETLPDLKLFNLVPDGKLTLTAYSFTFPSPRRDLWYHFREGVPVGTDPVTGATLYSVGCTSYTALVGEEWGPGAAQPIADVLLGDMPPYTDYIDVRIKLTRTAAPDSIQGAVVPTIATGNWIDLRAGGGATILEGWPGFFLREMEIVLDHPGEAVVKAYLRLKTSIRPLEITPVKPKNQTGWVVGISAFGIFGKMEQNKDPTVAAIPPSNFLQKGGNSPCDSTVSGNWSSTYTGDIEITPGRVSAA